MLASSDRDICEMERISAIGTLLDGSNSIQMINAGYASVSNRLDAFLSLEFVIPLHETTSLDGESLEDSWDSHREYISGMERILGVSFGALSKDQPYIIDPDSAKNIIQQLGSPPYICRPIYLISVGTGREENVVYVGKAASRISRFRNGHAAHTKLTSPEYDGLLKRLYLASVILVANDGSQGSLEFVPTKELANQILMSIEAQLIHQLRPRFNVQNVNQFSGPWPITLNIQNWTDQSNLLSHTIYVRPDVKWECI